MHHLVNMLAILDEKWPLLNRGGFLAKDVTACLDRRCALGLVQIIMNLAAFVELYIFWS